MIIYDLICDNKHRFEGWFGSAGDFDSQHEQQLIRCPQCDSASVRRIPSAVAIGGHAPNTEEAALPTPQSSATTALMPVSAQVAAAYRALVETIVASSEDVGTSFAEEARKIHYNEAPERSIRGQVTRDECEALKDEGIEIVHLPVMKDEDLN
jgi:hypothetical protein